MTKLEKDVLGFMQLHHIEKTGMALHPSNFHEFAKVIYNKFPKALDVRDSIQSLRSRIDDENDDVVT